MPEIAIVDAFQDLARKGGSWSNEARLCRAASCEWPWQGDRYNDIGLRVVISAII